MKYYLGQTLIMDGSEELPKCIVKTREEARQILKELNQEIPLYDKEEEGFCKAEVYPGYLKGSMCIPSFEGKEEVQFSFLFNSTGILFVDETGYVKQQIQRMAEANVPVDTSMGKFFYAFVENIIKTDLRGLENIEGELSTLEDKVFEGKIKNFNHTMSSIRKRLSSFNNYYMQLEDMTLEFQENENNFFNKAEIKSFNLLQDRCNRLSDRVNMIKSYSSEVREIYQAQIDISQNQIMKVLTIVTTVFAPLTLIVGWYGMNFTHMPELAWEFGYPVIIVISIVVTLLSVWYFKKKRYF